MSDVQALARPRPAIHSGAQFGVPGAVAIAIALGVALSWSHALDIWNAGAFYDTDDALRMVQVRDLLAGQSWFDMTIARMNPPDGLFMHWSRTVDVPLVALMKFFGLFAAPAEAEALTRLAFPLMLLTGLYFAVGWAASTLGGRKVAMTAVGLVFASGAVFGQFTPGRIDHHAPQILLLTLATGALLAALESSRAKLAALAGVCMALSLSISVENLPFFPAVAATPAIAWIFHGRERKLALAWFALGLIVALLVCFGATVGPQRWFVAACDAYSIAHLGAGLAGGAALLVLAALTAKLPGKGARLIATAVAGMAPLIAVKLVAPACLGDPFVGLDPLVRAVWLDHVAEVQRLPQLAADHPYAAITIATPLALSALATALAAFFAHDVTRGRLVMLAALIATGFAMTFWGVRVYSSTAPLAAIGAAFAVVTLARRITPTGALRGAVAALFCLPFATLAYALVLPSDKPDGETRSLACLRPSAIKPLDALPRGLVLAPIDAGSHLLAFTHHFVLAAPYHRNNDGDRLSIEIFLSSPDKAQVFAQKSGADYLLFCAQLKQARTMAKMAPDGLAAALIAGRVPSWLEPIDAKAAPDMAFRIRKAGAR